MDETHFKTPGLVFGEVSGVDGEASVGLEPGRRVASVDGFDLAMWQALASLPTTWFQDLACADGSEAPGP